MAAHLTRAPNAQVTAKQPTDRRFIVKQPALCIALVVTVIAPSRDGDCNATHLSGNCSTCPTQSAGSVAFAISSRSRTYCPIDPRS